MDPMPFVVARAPSPGVEKHGRRLKKEDWPQ